MLQVFAEKMGLEAGWNCHISLSPEIRLNMFKESTNSVGIEPNDSSQKLNRYTRKNMATLPFIC